MIIAFASFTKIKNNSGIGLVIIDYFGCTEASPKEIISSFKYEYFQGKGIGELLINMIQVISNRLCNDKDNVILLKCADDLQSYYESVGFQKVQDDSEWLQIPNVKTHYNEINATKHLHVKQSLINIDLNKE